MTEIESGSIDSLKSMHQTTGILSSIVAGMHSFIKKKEIVPYIHCRFKVLNISAVLMNFYTGSTVKQHKESLLKFFKLNDENPASENATLNITNSSGKCGLLSKKLCAQKHKSNSNTFKKSFRPHYYDDDDEEDSDDYDETPDDEDFPEEAETGSYRSYAPRDHERPYDDEYEDYDSESWRGHDFEDEDSEPHERPGYEGDMDDWDWDAPRPHRERHAFKGAGIISQHNDFALTLERITVRTLEP